MASKAGGIPFYFDEDDRLFMLFMVPADPKRVNLPQIPKGGIKKGESKLEAVYREVEEETGLQKKDVKQCFKVFSNSGLVLFAMEVEKNVPLKKFTKETEKIVWKNELQLDGIKKDHKQIVEKIIEKIKNQFRK